MDIIGSGLLECNSEILRNDDIHHINLLNVHAILVETLVKLQLHCLSQFWLQVTNLIDSMLSDEISNTFLCFLFQ